MHLNLNPYMTLGDFGIEAEVHGGVLQEKSLYNSYFHKASAASSSAKCLKGKTSMPSLVVIAGPRG
jgi:hypothetical protein